MSRFILRGMIATLLGCGVVGSQGLLAQGIYPGNYRVTYPGSYPLVYGPTGRPYGPTQAHYQYQRQYGHPWQGDGVHPPAPAPDPNGTPAGFAFVAAPFHGNPYAPYGLGIGANYPGFFPGVVGGYGYGGYGYGYPPYGFGYGFPPYVMSMGGYVNAPFGFSPVPGAVSVQPAPLTNKEQQIVSPGGKFWQKNQPKVASPQEKEQAARLLAEGDQHLRARRASEAIQSYQQAAQLADDQAAPHLRLCIAWAALRNYRESVTELKRAVARDPSLPVTGNSPLDILGQDQKSTVDFLLQSVAQWAREDIRDADRLFLIGAMLQLTGDPERATIPLQSAARLTQGASHVMAFLNANQQQIQQVGNKQPAAAPVTGPEEQPTQEPVVQQVPKRLPSPPKPAADDNQPVPVPKRGSTPSEQPKKQEPAAPQPPPAKAEEQPEQPVAPTKAEEKADENESGPVLPNPSGN
ncbi:MAG: hypothetical protein U0903_11225 [Planctomycetales bacterium]